jgi:hypothetical protein
MHRQLLLVIPLFVLTTGLICAEPGSTASTVASVAVAFPTGFTVNTAANWAVSTGVTTGWPTGATAWPGVGTATNVTGQVVTFPSSNLTSTSTVYCFNWTNTAAITTPVAAGNNETGTITTQTSAPAAIDTGSYATATVSNDQVTVTGTVSPSFSMSVTGGNADPLGTLTQGSVSSSAATTFTVNTNAQNGWMAWVKDANSGLKSNSAGYTISSTTTPGVGSASSALSAGTEGINLGVTYAQTSGSCTAGSAVNANFTGTASKGGSFNTTLLPILTCSGSTNNGVITPTNYASINGSTPAATDYSDLETFVAAGIF